MNAFFTRTGTTIAAVAGGIAIVGVSIAGIALAMKKIRNHSKNKEAAYEPYRF